MKIAGITGGIGSGKSIVCSIFKVLGVPVYDADNEAKSLYDKFPELKEKISKEISSEIFEKGGKIDRRKIAQLVFSDPEKLKLLNSLVHPYVRKDFQIWCKRFESYPYVIKEAAILFESGAYKDCDLVITVISPLDLRIQRVRERDRKSKSEVERIIENQWSDEEKIKRSDHVIHNDEKSMLIPQVLTLHEQFTKEFSKPLQTKFNSRANGA